MTSKSSQSSTSIVAQPDFTDDQFYAVIDRLKAQKCLPQDSFAISMPFFTFANTSKQSQVRELFNDVTDPIMYQSMVKSIISQSTGNSDLVGKRLSAIQMMNFAQIILYKVLPCTDANCQNKPREVVTHNQYRDYEYECPFYHHDADQRRLTLTSNIDDEFTYKANYGTDTAAHSQNYFESMFHPLYYKMFRCKREYCNMSQCCPFFHSEEEKKTWDRVFSNFIRKDRISYAKEKQRYQNNDKPISRTNNRYDNNNKNQNQSSNRSTNFTNKQQKQHQSEQTTSGWRSQVTRA